MITWSAHPSFLRNAHFLPSCVCIFPQSNFIYNAGSFVARICVYPVANILGPIPHTSTALWGIGVASLMTALVHQPRNQGTTKKSTQSG